MGIAIWGAEETCTQALLPQGPKDPSDPYENTSIKNGTW